MVVTGPTTGQTLSSISFALGSSTRALRAGHFCASADAVASFLASLGTGTDGCLERLLWCSVFAPTTGQVWPGFDRSTSGWEGGRTELVVPTTGQTPG